MGFLTQLDAVSLCSAPLGGIILDWRVSDLDFLKLGGGILSVFSILLLEKVDRVRVRVRLCEPVRQTGCSGGDLGSRHSCRRGRRVADIT